MNTNQRMAAVATVVVAGGLLAQALSYHGGDYLQVHPKWLSLAVLAVAVGVGAFVWAGRK